LRDSAVVYAVDTFQGRKRYIAKLRLRFDDAVMIVEPIEGNVQLFPVARIVPDPNTTRWPNEFCAGKRDFLTEMAEEIGKDFRSKKNIP
jgi:hypothetical protein